jgi:hypothetical protein
VDYLEANAQLTGRCCERRKIANNTRLIRRGRFDIAVRLHSTDIITFHNDGRIDVFTGGWDTVTTRDRINRYLPKPWHCYGERGATILSNHRWYAGQEKSPGIEVVLDCRARIEADGSISGGASAKEYRDRIRQADNELKRTRSHARYWTRKARDGKPARGLTVASILAEPNISVRVCKMKVFGFDRFMLEAHASVKDQRAGYQLLDLALDAWRNLRALKMTCPSTQAVYVSPVPPEIGTVPDALNWIYDVPDYFAQLAQEA